MRKNEKEEVMLRSIETIIGILADIVVYWAIPIVGAALFSSAAAIIIAANPFVGATVVIIVGLLLVYYCLREQAVWQAITWGALLVPYSALAIFAPHWAVLWGLGISLLALGVLLIPGSVLPHGRVILTTAILAAVGLHTVLAMNVWSHGMVFLTVIGLLAVAAGSILFYRGARPYEIRRAQRLAGRLATTVGVLLVALGLIAPRLSIPALHISVPKPVVSVWDAVISRTEAWATASRRTLIGERAKTNALSELETDLQQAHRERWQGEIQQIPVAPFTPEEWRELAIQ
jgi:hypothetical protein